MKRNVLSLLIPALFLAATGAHAAEVYNKNGNKLNLTGEVHGLHYFSKDDDDNGDQSTAKLGINGETQINERLSGYGQWEYEFDVHHTESAGAGESHTRLAFAGLKYASIGSLDYGRNYGAVYDITSWTDVLPEFGADTYSNDNFMQNRGTGMLTYHNSDFFGLVEGLNFTLQYQGANKTDRDIQEANGDGFAASVSYDSPVGFSIGAALSNSKRTSEQNGIAMTYGKGDNAQTYTAGVKYDANNIYLAAQYTQTYNATYINDGSDGFANKASNFEIVAKYDFDFGLSPSLAYLESKGHDIEGYGDQNLLRYVDIALNHDFNENMTVYVDYKINLLKDNDFTKDTEIKTDNIVAFGVVYQF